MYKFLQYTHSDLLYEQWLLYKLEYNAETQKLGDLLFSEVKNIKSMTCQEFENMAKKLEKDPQFLELMV
ncbi:MAG TPA: hypothetical protein VLG50_07500 [Candidatus Saccharimonadales bacterium]|nr:hypothetical protein [Candidatus Saccharimonadales bacterium]